MKKWPPLVDVKRDVRQESSHPEILCVVLNF